MDVNVTGDEETPMYGEFGARVREARAGKFSCEGLARQVGISLNSMHRIETGKAVPKLYTAQAIAAALEVTLDSLVGRDLEATPGLFARAS